MIAASTNMIEETQSCLMQHSALPLQDTTSIE